MPSFSLSMIRVGEQGAPLHHYSEYFGEASHQLFASAGHVFAARSDDPAAFSTLLRAKRPVGNLVAGAEAFVRGTTYVHLFEPNGIHHVLDFALRDGAGPLGILGICREKSAPAFGRSEVAMAMRAYPHLVHAMAQRRGGELRPDAYDETGCGLLLARVDGAVVFASEGARRWLADASSNPERAALLDRGELPIACRELYRRWEAGRRVRGSDELAGPPTLCLPVPGGRVRLRAYGVDAEPGNATKGGLIAVQIALEMSRELRLRQALSASRLSPQLQRIAIALWQGLSPPTIAARLGIGAGTLKTYQKELYARLGFAPVWTTMEITRVPGAEAS